MRSTSAVGLSAPACSASAMTSGGSALAGSAKLGSNVRVAEAMPNRCNTAIAARRRGAPVRRSQRLRSPAATVAPPNRTSPPRTDIATSGTSHATAPVTA